MSRGLTTEPSHTATSILQREAAKSSTALAGSFKAGSDFNFGLIALPSPVEGRTGWETQRAITDALLFTRVLMILTRRSFIQRMAQIGGYSAAFSTMRALGLIATPGVSTLPKLPGDFGKGEKVVILGAGSAGLVAAYELRKAGFE